MSITKTFIVIVCGAVASFVLLAFLSHLLLKPVSLAKEVESAGRSDDNRTAFQRDFQRAHLLAVFLINPLLGLSVGLFVGLFQKAGAGLTAMACLAPQFFFRLYANGWSGWSDERLLNLFGHQILVFIPALLAAHYVWTLRNRGTSAQDSET